MKLRLRHKLLLVVGAVSLMVFGGIAMHYTAGQEKIITREYERAIHKMSSSVVNGLESIMLENHAEIMKEYSTRLKAIPDIREFAILRTDGHEAFRDNSTIQAVNDRLGGDDFELRTKLAPARVMAADDPWLQRLLRDERETVYEVSGGGNQRQMVFLDPIPNAPRCQRCHGKEASLRGLVRIVSSLDAVDSELSHMRMQSGLLVGFALILTVLATNYLLARSVVRPIESVTRAMQKISSGQMDHQVPLRGSGEIRHMAESFNSMTRKIRDGYEVMLKEKDKLSSVIHGSREAVVITNPQGEIVLVNPASLELLGKTEAQIRADGFLLLLDDARLMEQLQAGNDADDHSATIQYKERWLLVNAAAIQAPDGRPMGAAAMIRDVTDEKALLEQLRQISITDALTGVFNRRHLDNTLRAEFARSRRYGTPLSVLLFDVDHFKKFNDTHGHDQGDRVLQAMGKAMREAVRQYDVPCRYGGEEFVAILPAANAPTALEVAEHLRKHVEAMVVDGLRVTISIGVATYPDLAVETAEALIEASDAALYKSKEKGRNCVSVAMAATA